MVIDNLYTLLAIIFGFLSFVTCILYYFVGVKNDFILGLFILSCMIVLVCVIILAAFPDVYNPKVSVI